MSTTNVPRPTFSDTGVAAPTEPAILAGLWADFQTAFGGKLNPSDATPQGQLVAALAAVLGGNNDLFLEFVNQVDPQYSSGRMQDAIGRIYYLTRQIAEPTTVVATCTGAVGTVIPVGSLAKASDDTIYQSLGAATIPAGGSVDVTFAAIDTGPIACPSGTLGTIYRVVPGWDTITNAADGVPGRDVESRIDFENRRAQSVAGNASGILPAIRGAVLSAAGVVDAFVSENATAAPVTVGGVTIAARSLYVAAYGGTDADVAKAIWSRKPPGCGYTGTTTVTVQDTSSGYTPAYPTYSVKFTRAAALRIYMAVDLANNGSVPADVQDQVRNAIVSAFNGVDGGPRARIGSTIYALRFATAIAVLGPWVQLISLAIGATASPTTPDVAVDIDKMPTLDPADIAITLT